MAGIGFELQKLSVREDISGRVTSMAQGSLIAAGPWLITIVCLGLVSLSTSASIDVATLASFRVVIIYAFAVSLTTTAPVVMVATRLLSDALYAGRPEAAMPILVSALAGAGAVSGTVVAVLYGYVFAMPLEIGLAGFIACLLVSFLWVAVAFSGAIYDHVAVSAAFAAGMIVALVGTILAALQLGTATSMVWTFNVGIATTLFALLARVILTFPFRLTQLGAAFRSLIDGLAHYRLLAAGALFGTLAIWIDKWMLAGSSYGRATAEGLRHAPIYDSAMFVAYLAVIPSLALFVIHLETEFSTRYNAYFRDIQSHATLERIERDGRAMGRQTTAIIRSLVLMQFGVCALVAAFAPWIVEVLGLQFQQVGVLRFGVFGTVFHFLLIACSSVVLFVDRRFAYMALHLFFFLAMAGATAATLYLGQQYLGYGYFAACVASGAVAYITMEAVLRRLDFYTFIANIHAGP